ncbi:MAG: NGG1p interacting factor NIF3 [Thermoplasmatota archaeon]
MKLQELYELAVDLGREADPRDEEEIGAVLRKEKEDFDKLDDQERERYDRDNLWNPYYDSRILYGDPEAEVESLMVGVDISTGEVVLADRLRERGTRVDALMGHHPHGKASGHFYEVMHLQENELEQLGIGITVAEGLFGPRIDEVMKKVHARNHDQSVDACRLMDIPFMCLHTPSDNQVQTYLQKEFDQNEPERVKDIMDILYGIPEYDRATRNNAGPKVFVGEKNKKAGKVVVDMTGGTSGPKEVYERLSQAGVGTIVGMHIPEENAKEAKKHHINVVIAGHMASDSLGLNLLVDKFEERGVSIIPCSGFIRVNRS